jgi:hypothetical protein
MKTNRIAAILLTLFMIFALSITPVMAGNPHFIKAGASVDDAGNLVLSWKEVGFGSGQVIDYVASTWGYVWYACLNPAVTDRVNNTGTVTTSGAFDTKGSKISAGLIVPPPPSPITCLPGEQLVVACVIYQDIAITDTTDGITVDLPDAFRTIYRVVDFCP